MKFGKEFSSQMVPEWQGAYMDYTYLKSILKDLHLFKLKNNHHHHHHHHHNHGGAGGGHHGPHGLARTLSLYRSFSGLLRNHSISKPTTSSATVGVVVGSNDHHHDIEEQQVILVHPIMHDGHHQDHHNHHHHHHKYETKFLMSCEEGGEYELVFFRRLDDEFNKVNKFYRDKVEEVMKEAALLNKQMDALIAFRLRVDYPDDHGKLLFEQLSRDIAASAAALSASTPTSPGSPRATEMVHVVHMDVIEESTESSSHGNYLEESDPSSQGKYSDESNEDMGVDDETIAINHNKVGEQKPKNMKKATRPAPVEILNNVKINNTLETPRSTIKGILKINKNEELSFKKENLRKVEEQLKSAFIHFYHKLQLLKSYSFMNLMAFSKIMKRYDKVTSRSASRPYLNMVDNSYLGSSEDVTKLMERVEATFIKHFSNANRSKGMNILRPKKKRERHRTTFSLGFFSGCTIALIISLILVIHVRKILKKNGGTQYMETMFPLYSLFGFVVLHMLMYAANLYFWRCYRVNYPFIFGFKQGTELGYRQVFLLSTGLATLALASVLANLDMEMDEKTKDYKKFTELIPLVLVGLVLLITFCPFNIVYRSSRFFLLRTAFHGLCAPLYKVTLPDFLLADQLTSQVQAIRSLEFYICYYGWGDYKRRQSTCKSNDVYNTFYFIIATIPYWSRFLQCLRRWFEEKDKMQGYNGLKYFCTIVAVVMRTAYSKQNAAGWWILALISSVIAAVSSTYWDLVIDWGLLQRNSKNPWLRDKLLVQQKSVYFGAMVLDVLLRFAWLQTVLNFKVPFLHNEAMVAIVASLEIIRRGVWNFFRLENEHLNNVGKYRAFKTVPLPFNYDEEEEKDE